MIDDRLVVSSRGARLGADIGGTFTDAALEIDGKRFTAKTLTTHAAPDDGVLTVMELCLEAAGLSFDQLDLVVHGTTLATNALIERRGAKTGMLTTAGFRDIIEVGQEYRFDLFDLMIDLPTPLVERRMRLPIDERCGAGGKELLPLNEDQVRAAAKTFAEEGVSSVAICFLHSYANATHEERAREILLEELPHLNISLSSAVAPEMREYERFCTACANAYVQPKIAGYLSRLEARLRERGLKSQLLVMLSGGGLTTVETANAYPVRLVESGPAGGAVFASSVAAENGLSDVVSFDMGGTTAKICLIDGGRPQTSRTFEVGRVYRFKKGSGIPIRIPVIEMVEIGAGGGSIAHIDRLGRVSVGPESAGSEPGPVAYGRGGDEPTVTDADVALSRINPLGFAGGRFPLDAAASAAALLARIGAALGIGAIDAAAAVVEMVEENMAAAARIHAVESGKEIRDRTLIAFGGAAPLHVAGVMRKLGMKRFLVPAAAGVGSAVGFLRAPVSYEIVRSQQRTISQIDFDALNAMLAQMSAQSREIVAPSAGAGSLRESRSASMRYVGQGHEITVEVETRVLGISDRTMLLAAFERRYQEIYRRIVPNAEVEVLSWSVHVSSDAPVIPPSVADVPESTPRPTTMRLAYDSRARGLVEHGIYWRPELPPGSRIVGPAVIEEEETSTLVPSGMSARIVPSGAILCEEIEQPGAGAVEKKDLVNAH